ncbi:MAG TPA: GNAT family N-acetyltransferase [bacterium]|nr:GNAT family N-acetyltransferase [bacterium]HPN43944.1 GNAT family N-acetyltransferase [bacterium]
MNIRNLELSDINQAMLLEKAAWSHDTQATRVQLEDRLTIFKEGFFGAFTTNEKLIGMASSQIITYSPNDSFKSWETLTSSGWISKTHQPQGNCLHFVSICVHPENHHQGIGKKLNKERLHLAEKLHLKYVLTDTRLPGLSSFLKSNINNLPKDYLAAIKKGEIIEPVVQMYLSLGFQALGLIPDCMKSDEESANFGLAMLKEI